MAIFRKGPLKDGSGKLGDYVFYQLDGMTVARTIGEISTPATVSQLSFRKSARLITNLLHPVKKVAKIGFSLIASGAGKNAYNCAFSYNLLNAVSGIYPDLEIDFTKVLFTKGEMPVATAVEVVRSETGLNFSWAMEESTIGTHWSDNAIMIAYIPALQESMCFTNGARRHQGTDHLPLKHIKRGHTVQTYLAFISDDHKNISDSVFTGQFFW